MLRAGLVVEEEVARMVEGVEERLGGGRGTADPRARVGHLDRRPKSKH
jgi:hypothetical protein